jgi:type I restriction enzyme S subunit
MMASSNTELPHDWAWATIEEVTEPRVEQAPPEGAGNFIYVDISSIENQAKEILEQKTLLVSQAPSRARQQLKAHDVLVSMTRPNLNAVAMVPLDLNGSIGSTGFDVLRTKWIIPSWLFYLVQTDDFIQAMSSLVQGVLYPAVRPKDIRTYRIPVASLPEQRRIVEEIEKQFTRLEAAVAALKRVQANLKRYRAAVLKSAVEGRLVPTEAELACAEGRSYEPASELLQRILSERRARWEAYQLAKFRASGKEPKDEKWKHNYVEPSGPERACLPELPKAWIWSSIGQLFDVHVGATPSRAQPEYWNGDIPWVSSGEVAFCRLRDTREKITQLGLDNTSTELHPPGTVLLGMIGEGKTRGQSAILEIDACNNQNSAAICVSGSGLPPEYVYYYLQGRYEETRRMSSGGNQPALNKARVRTIVVPLSPLAEQKRIVTEVERRLSVIDELEMQVEVNLKRAERLRQAILKRAFEGKLVPQDPSDEPASVLLERIRAVRAHREGQDKAKSQVGRKNKQPRIKGKNVKSAEVTNG